MEIETKKSIFFKCALVLGVGVAVVPFAVRYGLQILVNWKKALSHFIVADSSVVDRWHQEAVSKLKLTRLPEVIGIIFVPCALSSFFSGGYFVGLSAAETLALGSVIALAAFSSGVALYSLLYLARLVWSLGDFSITVEPHKFGILAIGRGLLRCYATAAVIWCIISLSGSWELHGTWPPVAFIGIPALFIIVGSFIVCQLPLHRRMIEYKRDCLYGLDRSLALLRSTDPEQLTDERLRRLQYFVQEREYVIALPEWPFDWRSFSGVVVSSIVPALPILFQIAAKRILKIP